MDLSDDIVMHIAKFDGHIMRMQLKLDSFIIVKTHFRKNTKACDKHGGLGPMSSRYFKIAGAVNFRGEAEAAPKPEAGWTGSAGNGKDETTS